MIKHQTNLIRRLSLPMGQSANQSIEQLGGSRLGGGRGGLTPGAGARSAGRGVRGAGPRGTAAEPPAAAVTRAALGCRGVRVSGCWAPVTAGLPLSPHTPAGVRASKLGGRGAAQGLSPLFL